MRVFWPEEVIVIPRVCIRVPQRNGGFGYLLQGGLDGKRAEAGTLQGARIQQAQESEGPVF